MFGIGILEVVLVLAVPVALLAGVAVASVSVAARDDLPRSREWVTVVGIRVAGALVGLGAAVALAAALDGGRGVVLAPAVAGLGVLAGVALGETVVRPRRTTGPRSASLRPRTAWAYVPRPLGLTLLGVLVVHLATLALTTATADRGRSFSCRVGEFSASNGPYPGSSYSVPLLVVLAVVGVVAAVAARVVVQRPRGYAVDEAGDDILRRRSLTVIVAATGLAVAATHVGVALAAASALGNVACAPLWAERTATLLLLTVPVAFLAACWCGVRLFLNDRSTAAERATSR